MKKILLLLIFTFFGIVNSVYSQVICGGTFTDPAGPNANYTNNSNFTTTICPTNVGDVVTVSFTSFALENNFDFLKVYNGTSASAVLIANLTGTSIPQELTSTDPTGCLTFVFTSDGTSNNTGWTSNITCGPPVTTNCLTPTLLSVTNVTPNSATLSWTANNGEASWELLTSLNGGAYTSTFVQQNPYVLTGLSCDSTYQFLVSASCNNGVSVYAGPFSFATLACPPQAGQPINLSQCADNGQACFNLTVNDQNIYGTLNPSDYTITYHASQADANADVNALTSPYCTFNSQQVIYARLEYNTTQGYQILPFGLIIETVSNGVATLENMTQCDDNNDTTVTFNLTNIQAQINSTNTFVYYTSLANAQNQVVPVANPAVFTVGTQSQITTIFVREIVPNSCDIIYTFQVIAYANCNVAYTCGAANSLCNSLGVPFANTVSIPSSGSANCLGSTPNPTWFYLPVSVSGAINLQISQGNNAPSYNNLDVDYIIYGPFTNPVTPCTSGQLLNNVVSCSYSAAPVENATIPNAVTGQYYLVMVTNFSNSPGLITIIQTNTSGGTIDCSGIRLNAFLDVNNNGSQDNGEQNFPLGQFTYEVNNNGNVHNIIAPTGVYNIYDTNALNSYDVSYSIDANYAASYGITTASYSNVHVVIGGGMQTYNFPINITQSYDDLAVVIVPVNAPRPFFTYDNKIVYTNFGNQTVASGTVTFNKDALVTITGNTQSGTTNTVNGFTYNFTNLLPFESRTMTVTMQVPNIPTVNIGGLLTNTAAIAPVAGDVVPTNNNTSLSQIIIGSYDPNDKMESHGERILFSSFTPNDVLYYTIRFENSGTASAINVRINDVLDSQLDETSIRMISASHPYVMDRVDNNINWRFDNIQLPVYIANTNIGKGYITFSVKPRPGYAVGDIIPNTASIYFDFNPAIVTNTFNTEFVAQLSVSEFENGDFIFYPNPVNDVVTVSLKNTANSISNIAVYDVLGKLIFAKKPSNTITTETIDLSSVSKGLYLLEVTTDTNLKVVKKLMVK